MRNIFLIILFSLFSSPSFACGVSTPNYVNLAISTIEEKIFSYSVKTSDEKLPGAFVSNCRETALKRRFVMITFGPEMTGLNDSIRGTNFDKQFAENTICSIKNNPINALQSISAEKANFESKWKFINECVEVHVTELGSKPLSFPTDQTGCTIKSVNSKSALFNGGFCFLKPNTDSEWNVSVTVKESCKKINGYRDLGINLQDLESGVNFYTSSTYKDEINDLSAFGSFAVRLSVNPSPTLFRASDDFGILRPTFPEDFPVNDIHLGKLEIIDEGENVKYVSLKTPLIVNNVCQSIEKNGLKSSICDYATPYVGEISLINSKGQVEATWFDGGIAPTQWQGILNGEGSEISKELLRKNETYKLEVSFADPYFEFNTFKKRIKSKFQALTSGLPVFYAGGGISEIPDLRDLVDINPILDINPIGELDFKTGLDGLDNNRKRLNAFFSTTLYPPMYTQACSPNTGTCQKTGKPFVKFTASFKVDSDYKISELLVERNSKILGSYKKKITQQPEMICN